MSRTVVSGTLRPIGDLASITVCVGFLPDEVDVWNHASGNVERASWNREYRGITDFAGLSGSDGTFTEKTIGTGIARYRGGDKLAVASTAIYIRDPLPDKRGSGATGVISRWTLDTAANRTGHFNNELNITAGPLYTGVGAQITVREDISGAVKTATILALTSNGEVADEVTLSEALKSGTVLFLTGAGDWIPVAAGGTTKDGFTLSETSGINEDTELLGFAARVWD